MMIAPGQLILLDTNVLFHYARDNATSQQIETEYQLTKRNEKPLFSTITEGELRGLTKANSWGERRLKLLDEIFSELVRVESGTREVVDAYAEIYATGRGIGHFSETKQNDLWIAATARATNAVLFTCDHDFDWIHDQNLIQRVYIDPDVTRNPESYE